MSKKWRKKPLWVGSKLVSPAPYENIGMKVTIEQLELDEKLGGWTRDKYEFSGCRLVMSILRPNLNKIFFNKEGK